MTCTCRFVPARLLLRIAERGNPAQRAAALATLAVDQTVRLTRATRDLLESGSHAALATGGEVVRQRTVYDTAGTESLPGKRVRSEGAAPTGDAAADEAYDGLGATFDFYRMAYERNSIDDEGLPLDATVHYGQRYDNAFWNGQQMVFGDGDGDLFNRFTVAVDVIGHELTHGVTGDEAGLVYVGQPGALNESISDVFGSLVKQYALKQTAAQADWLIGAGLFTARVHGVALRSMKAPGTAFDDPVLGRDEQPASMHDYVRTTADNGGVHINSGIPNRAFYLAAAHFGGHAWETAGRIWYETLRDKRLRRTATFAQFARYTTQNADRHFGAAARAAVAAAWSEVGVLVK